MKKKKRKKGRKRTHIDTARLALVAACRAICVFCKEDVPYCEEQRQHVNLYHCKAQPIQVLIRALDSKDWSLNHGWKRL